MTEIELQEMIKSQREEIEALRKERDELKSRLEGGDVDAEVKKYLDEKYSRDKKQRERQAVIKNGLL